MTAPAFTEPPTLSTALALAAKGYAVIAYHCTNAAGICSCKEGKDCAHPGKHPRTRNGYLSATTDAAEIRKWWHLWPTANLAIDTGPRSGVDALDVDPKHGGLEALAAYEREYGQLPDTARERTGSGGRHYYFKHRPGIKAGASKCGNGMDVLSTGLPAICGPSRHANGKSYEWQSGHSLLEQEPADWPDALYEMAKERPKPARDNLGPIADVVTIPAWVERMVESGAIEGERNVTGFKVACRLIEEVYDSTTARHMFTRYGDRCSPALTERELERIWKSASDHTEYGPDPKYQSKARTLHIVDKATGEIHTPSPEPEEAPEPAPISRGALAFPVEALLSPILIRWVTEAATALDSPPDFPAWGALAACSGAIGMSRMIRVNNEWSESALLWVVLVGNPGTSKSPALTKAGAPLWEIQNRYITQYEQAVALYKRSLEQWEATAKQMRGDKPKEPVPYRFLVADATLEALTRILSLNDRGVLVIRDELAAWVESFGQYKKSGGQDRAAWLGFWSSSPVIIDRKTDNYTAALPRPFTSVVGTIQPERLAKLMGGENDGFNDRMLFVFPDAEPMNWTDASISDEANIQYATLLAALLELKMTTEGPLDNAGYVPVRVSFTPEAQKRFGELFQAHRAEMVSPSLPPRLLGAYAKIRSYAARVALILHTVLVEEDLTGKRYIEPYIVEAAWRIAEYSKSHACKVYGMSGRTEEDTAGDRAVTWIKARGGTTTARDLMRAGVAGISARTDAELLLTRLVDRELGAIELEQTKGGKRMLFKLFGGTQ